MAMNSLNHSAFRMRTFSGILLALLVIVIAAIAAPNVFQGQNGLLQTTGILFALCVLIIGMVLIRRMNNRLARLAKVAEAIGQGDYTTRSTDSGGDAIGLLAKSINSMADRIQHAITELETQQNELRHNRAQLEEQNTKLAHEYQRQTSFGEFLTGINTVDINTIADKGLNYILSIAQAQLGQVYLVDEKTKALLKVSERGIDRQALQQLVIGAPEHGLPGEVLNRRETIRIETLDETSLPKVNLGFSPAELRCVIGWPILFQQRTLGVILLGALHQLDNNAMRSVQNTIDALGSVLNNAMTYKTVQQQKLRLEQANQELLEADRLRSEFVANMSHELRTPLNSIIGFSGVLQKNRNQSLLPKDLDYVEKINRNGKHLLSLINDILDLSKIEAGRMDLDFVATNINPLVTEVVEMLQTQADARQLSLEFKADADLPNIEIDTEKLKQVLINLVGNAIKFTHQGNITLETRRVGDDVVVDIGDTGIGIPSDKLNTIFEPFRQADSGTTRQYGGTGLGLAITRSIVDLLGGKVSVSSEVGKGSVFSVWLPKSHEQAVYKPHRITASDPSLETTIDTIPAQALSLKSGTRCVLVVDDDPDARELLFGYIEDMGAQPIGAANGEQAIELAQKYQPDLITLDLMMPGIDGWEVLRRLKADPALENIPVVIISIVAERRRALILGAMDALTKPIAQDDLLAILRRTLTTSRKGHVLVVDDNPEVLELFSSMLAHEVTEIRTAVNGKDALQVLQNYQPDLIFLDLMMPEMDGLTFLRILRTEKQLMHLPVVIVTAKQLSEAERRELEMRVVQIIQKGNSQLEDQLKETLEQVLNANAA